MTTVLSDIERRLDEITTSLLIPLRANKTVDPSAMGRMRVLLADLGTALDGRSEAPKSLVGKLYFVYISMLAEADHAKVPGPIIHAAGEVDEGLRKVFGPHLG